MDLRKLIAIFVIVCLVIVGASYIYMSSNNSHEVIVNNTTKNTTNITSNATNGTVNEDMGFESASYSESSGSNSEPAYGSDGYVDKWDESQQGDGNWAYTHDQPVKTDEDGHSYKRMYDEDSGKSYWSKMD